MITLPEGHLLHQRYRIQRLIGEGSAGAVYLARDQRERGAIWAIKELWQEVEPEVAEQFQREVRLLSRLVHDGLPRFQDAFDQAGRQYLVMERIEGPTLQSILDEAGRPLPPAEVLEWGRQLCDVLGYLHGQEPPVVHRDVKPSNIMVVRSGQIKLIDLGVARAQVPHRPRDVDMRLEAGDVYGFIGPNGAGKTTTLRILATLTEPDEGEVRVVGHDLTEVSQIRRLIGYMPDFFGVYEDISVADYMQFFAQVYDIPVRQRTFAIDEALITTGMKPSSNIAVDTLSRGMKQRLGLARALLHRPRLLLLDEPASGLDPEARVEFREVIHQVSRQGTTVLVSSHVLSDLADMCNKVGILRNGCMRWQGPIQDLLARPREGRGVRLRVLDDGQSAHEILIGAAVRNLAWDKTDLVFDSDASDQALSTLLRRLMGAEVPVLSFSIEEPGLEQIYMEMVSNVVE